MNNNSQQQKAKKLLDLHQSNKILILPNIWDPLGASILQAEGFPAAATASAAISASLGYQDGEKIKLSSHLEIIKRIAGSVEIPITADLERGYASNLSDLSKSISSLLETGAVGINFEDTNETGKELLSTEDQSERIKLIRKVSSDAGVHLVINGRTDYFLLNSSAPSSELIKNLTARAAAFYEAGADCFYPVGLKDINIFKELRKEIHYPINALGSNNSESIKVLQDIGINRVSFGPFVQRALIKKFTSILHDLKNLGNISADEIVSKKDTDVFLRDEKE
jgi:2-methylisocitrate lyase-like PEP mutase family enzyme